MPRPPRFARLGLAGLLLLGACATAPAETPTPEPTVFTMTARGEPSATPGTTASPSPMDSPSPQPSAGTVDALLALKLTDVRSGEAFTLAELAAADGPVLLEPMAIWCHNCLAQQHEVVAAHEIGDFTSVSLDVDLTELPEDLAAYAEREGFDWRFAMADASLYRMLQERFGAAVTHPPSTPLIVIEADGTVRALEFAAGIRDPDRLLDEIDG